MDEKAPEKSAEDQARKRAEMRGKLTRRHRMMAAGASGITSRSSLSITTSSTTLNPGFVRQVTCESKVVESRSPPSTAGTAEDRAKHEAGYQPLQPGSDQSPRDDVPASKPPMPRSVSPRVVHTSPERPDESYWQQQMRLLCEILCQWLNVLLIFVPIGVGVRVAHCNDAIVFAANFLAIIPLASMLGNFTEALSNHTGQLIGGLLNATFGNAVEMIMCIQAVKLGLIRVVQGNLLGSVLSNLLLVLGMAIFASGIVRKDSHFNSQGAAANMTCQLVASISVCLPTVFRTVHGSTDEEVLLISRICSSFLILVYGLFLFFMLKTHADLFVDENGQEEDEESMSAPLATLLLALCTLVVALCSNNLVDSIEGVSDNYGLPKAFIGVILLPIVGNAAEHATAVSCAYKGMMDLALGVAVGSSTQIALFVVPWAVMFGYIYDQPMDLNFRLFDTVCQMLSVFLVSQVLQHGNTNWLHGAMLMVVYFIIATQTWFIEEED